jgi:tetratricopeptide (TPR) repeat protein
LRSPLDAPTVREAHPLDLRIPPAAGSPAIPRPLDAAKVREGSDPASRRPLDEAQIREGSSPALGVPGTDAGVPPPEMVILRVPSARPPPGPRQVRRTDSPQSHDVKALIAQRLKLLDQGADHFQLLGVAHDVGSDALRKAYFDLARQLHPDRLAALGIPDDGKHAQRLFAQINAGFAILSSPTRRTHYLDVVQRGGEAKVRAEEAKTDELARRILDAEEAFRRGELALRRDQPQAAVTELERAIQLNPNEADYHALLAWSQFCAAADKPAIAPATRVALDQAIQRSPKAVTARFCLGRVERMLGRDREALRHFRDVLAACPGHAEAAAEQRVIEARLASGDKSGGLFSRFKR